MKKILIFISLSFFLLLSFSKTASADVLIIANKDVTETTLTKEDIQDIFLGKKVQWKDNSKIRFVTLKEGNLHKKFLRTYINRSATQYENHWRRMLFTGRGEKPKEFKSPEALIAYVTNTDGAIGYIGANTPVKNVIAINVK